MSIPVVLAAQDSPAPGAHGALGFVLSPVLGDHDKVLARGPRGLGERKGTAAVPSRAGWGGTTKGGQETNICTPRRVFQLLSCSNQTLLGCGFSPSHRTWQPPCCHCQSPPHRHSHPHPWGWCRSPGSCCRSVLAAWGHAGFGGWCGARCRSISVPCLPSTPSCLGTLTLPCPCSLAAQ